MKENAILARAKRKFKETTDSGDNLPICENLLNRNVKPKVPDTVWTGDTTYIPTNEGWLYLAVVIDALTMAWFRRQPDKGLILHLNRGSQYTSVDFQKLLKRYDMRGSMSRRGNCWDNAVTKTLFGSLKVERLHGGQGETWRAAMDEVVDWLIFYNRKRLHSILGRKSPMGFEEIWRRQQQAKAA